MKSMHSLLDEAEKEWRSEVKRDFPLWGNIPVARKTSSSDEDWQFYTDSKKIYANINDDRSLQEGFETIISEYWDGKPEDLARETMHYALFHELYHHLEAPFSMFGDDNDNKRTRQAIRSGLLKSEPDLSALEQIVRVEESENMVSDFILDNRFAIDNKVKGYVRPDIIPTFHFLWLQKSSAEANFYTITRFIYGALYGPQSTHGFFEDKTGKDGVDVAEEALSALINRPVRLPRQKDSLVDDDKSTFHTDPETYDRLQEYASDIREVFSGNDRYKGIERFMAVIGPYVKKGIMPREHPLDEENPAKNPQSVLQDLVDDMSPEEQKQFLDELSQESDDPLGLGVSAMHEFYKRNHASVKIYNGNKTDESESVGRQEHFYLKGSQIITEDQISRLNLKRIEYFELRGLPCLIELENGTYRLNEYGLKPRDLREIKPKDLKDAEQRSLSDILYADSSIDFHVPDVVEVYVNIGQGHGYRDKNFRVDDRSYWDMTYHLLYGFVDALREGGEKVGKKTDIHIHSIDTSIHHHDKKSYYLDSKLVSVDQFWEGSHSVIETLFNRGSNPDHNYHDDIFVCNYLDGSYRDGKKRTYVLIDHLGDSMISTSTMCLNSSDEYPEYIAKCGISLDDVDMYLNYTPFELQLLEISKSSGNKILLLDIDDFRNGHPIYETAALREKNPNLTYQHFTDNFEDKYSMMKESIEITL